MSRHRHDGLHRVPALLGAVVLASATAAGGEGMTQAEHSPEVQQAVTDLAGRLGLPAAAIEVVRREEVTWPNGSLGCPQPGMVYKQQLVNGSRLLLTAQGVEYAYHAGGSGHFRYCADPQPPLPTPAPGSQSRR
jgi:hypothetical protein